jgi:hypothetical protein
MMATRVKKKATMQKAAKKLNFPLTKLIIAMQHFSFKQPNKSFWSSTGMPTLGSQIVVMSYFSQVSDDGSVEF